MYGRMQNGIWRGLALFVTVLLLLCPLAGVPAFAIEEPEVEEYASAILYHEESGKVLFAQNHQELVEAGPAARLMAGLIYAESFEDLSETVKVNRRVTGLASSTMNPGLKSGESISVYDLLCGMLIANSEDAVYALAFHLFEDQERAPEKMIDKMNEKAAELGMEHTRFVRLVGSDPASADSEGNITTAEDLLLLTLAARKNRTVRTVCGIDKYTVPATDKTAERLLLTRNYMLSALRVGGYTYKNATGLAAENTPRTGYCVLAGASFEGKNFIAIVMGVSERYGAFKEAAKLFDYANGSFSYITVIDQTSIMGEIEVTLSGDADYLTVAPEKSISVFLPKDINVAEEIGIETEMYFQRMTAPVYEGTVAGKATLRYKGQVIGQVDLVTTGSLALNNSNFYLYAFRNFISSTEFLMVCAVIVIVIALYVLVNARVRYLRKNRPSSLEFAQAEPAVPPISPETPVNTPALGQTPGKRRKAQAAEAVAEAAAETAAEGASEAATEVSSEDTTMRATATAAETAAEATAETAEQTATGTVSHARREESAGAGEKAGKTGIFRSAFRKVPFRKDGTAEAEKAAKERTRDALKEEGEENSPEILSEYLARLAEEERNRPTEAEAEQKAWEEKIKAETSVGENYPLNLPEQKKVYDLMAEDDADAREEAEKPERKRTDYTPDGWN